MILSQCRCFSWFLSVVYEEASELRVFFNWKIMWCGFHVSCAPNCASCHQKYSQSCTILWVCYHGKTCHAFLGMICIQVIWKLLCHYLLRHMRIVLPGGCNFISVQISGYHRKTRQRLFLCLIAEACVTTLDTQRSSSRSEVLLIDLLETINGIGKKMWPIQAVS